MTETKSLYQITKENLIIYGKKTIEDRAIPSIEDGLKPVQRRIVWASCRLNLHHKAPLKKSARVVGDTMGKYHPHGDASIYDALVKLTKTNQPLMDGSHSNFGDFDSPPAAQRYTETRLTKFSDYVLLDKEYLKVTPMVSNYDGEFVEPYYLPSLLPIHLINGIEGIAFGCAVLMIPFDLKDVIDLTIKAFKKPKLKLINEKLLSRYLRPDSISFPQGGECETNMDEFSSIFSTGKVTLKFTPKLKRSQIIQKGKGTRSILTITSLAPRLKPEKLFQSLASSDLVVDIVNKSAKEKFHLEVTLTSNKIEDYQKIIRKITASISTQYIYLLRSEILPPSPSLDELQKSINDVDSDDLILSIPFKEVGLRDSFVDWLRFRFKLEKAYLKRRLIELQVERAKQLLLAFLVKNRKLLLKILDSNDPRGMAKEILIKAKLFDYDKVMTIDDCAEYILNARILTISKANQDKISEYIKSIECDIAKTEAYLQNPRRAVIEKTQELKEKLLG